MRIILIIILFLFSLLSYNHIKDLNRRSYKKQEEIMLLRSNVVQLKYEKRLIDIKLMALGCD